MYIEQRLCVRRFIWLASCNHSCQCRQFTGIYLLYIRDKFTLICAMLSDILNSKCQMSLNVTHVVDTGRPLTVDRVRLAVIWVCTVVIVSLSRARFWYIGLACPHFYIFMSKRIVANVCCNCEWNSMPVEFIAVSANTILCRRVNVK